MNYQPTLYKAAFHLLEALKNGTQEAEKRHLYKAQEHLGLAEIEALEEVYKDKIQSIGEASTDSLDGSGADEILRIDRTQS